MAKYVLGFLVVLFYPLSALTNSCCGQAISQLPILFDHQSIQTVTSISQTETLGRVFDGPDFYVWSKKDRTSTNFNFSTSIQITDNKQFFISGAYHNTFFADINSNNNAKNFSDTLTGYSYEFLPEFTYSPVKPQGFVSFLLNIPTGHSIYDKNLLSEGTDVTGHNQWGIGAGLSLRKVFFPLSIIFQSRTLYLLERQFTYTKVLNFFDISNSLFFNFATNFWDISISLGLIRNDLSPKTISASTTKSMGSSVTSLIFVLQKIVNDNISFSLSYSDQSFLGSPKNTLLNKTVSFSVALTKF